MILNDGQHDDINTCKPKGDYGLELTAFKREIKQCYTTFVFGVYMAYGLLSKVQNTVCM